MMVDFSVGIFWRKTIFSSPVWVPIIRSYFTHFILTKLTCFRLKQPNRKNLFIVDTLQSQFGKISSTWKLIGWWMDWWGSTCLQYNIQDEEAFRRHLLWILHSHRTVFHISHIWNIVYAEYNCWDRLLWTLLQSDFYFTLFQEQEWHKSIDE